MSAFAVSEKSSFSIEYIVKDVIVGSKGAQSHQSQFERVTEWC